MKRSSVIFMLFAILLQQSCIAFGDKNKLVLNSTTKEKKLLNATISSVNVSNNIITINGSGFGEVTQIHITGNGVDAELQVNSKNDSQVIASASAALSLLVSGTFDLIISTAEASATYPVTFSLQQMGASNGQVLKWDGASSSWLPGDLNSSQTYIGSWVKTPSETVLENAPNAGDYYITTVAGLCTSVSPNVNLDVGDWLMYNGSSWEKVPSGLSSKLNLTGGTVTGDVVLDTLLKFKGATKYVTLKASSSLASDITLTLPINTGTSGQVLTTNGSGVMSWTTLSTTAEPTGSAGGDLSGTYPNPTITGLAATKIGDGSVSNTEFQYLSGVTSNIQTQLNAKQGSGTFITSLTGDVTGTGPGATAATVAQVGGVTAANLATGAGLANGATSANTASTIVKRDSSGNFSAGTMTGTLNGNATNVTGTVAVANGGTGATSFTANELLFGNGTGAIGTVTKTSTPSVLLSTTVTGAPVWTTSTSGNFLQGGVSGLTFGPITNITPGGNFTVTQNSVNSIVSEESGAVANTLYLKAGKVGIGTTSPAQTLEVAGSLLASNNIISGMGAGSSPSLRLGASGQGFFSPGVNIIGFSTALNERMRIDATGQVGIGTTAPDYKLHINSSSGDAATAISAPAGSKTYWRFLEGTTAKWSIGKETDNSFYIYNSAAAQSNLSITPAGNVGIGASAPTSALSITSSSSGSGSINLTGNSGSGTLTTSASMTLNAGDYIIPTTTTGQARSVTTTATGTSFTVSPNFSANVASQSFTVYPAALNINNGKLYVQGSTGNVGIGTVTPAGLLHLYSSGTTALTVEGASRAVLQLSKSSSNFWDFGTTVVGDDNFYIRRNGATQNFTITTGGNVGIATTAPASPLEVSSSNNSSIVWNTTLRNNANIASTGFGTGIKFKNSVDTTSAELNKWTGIGGVASVNWSSMMDLVFYGTSNSGASAPSERMRLTGDGKLGIGTTGPSSLLHVVSATAGATVAVFESGTGSCTVIPNSGMACSSDIRLKENVEEIMNGLDKVLHLRGVTFQWKERKENDDRRNIGFVAQEMEKVAPELVIKDKKGYKQVNYANFVAVLTEAIKEFYYKWFTENQSMKREIASIKAENARMRLENEEIRKALCELGKNAFCR